MAEWVRALAWNGDRTFPVGFKPHFGKNVSLRNFGNSVYPSLPVSFGRDTKSRLIGMRPNGMESSLLAGIYVRRSKRSHQSALECVNVVDSTSHSKSPSVRIYGARRCPAKLLRRRKKTINNIHLIPTHSLTFRSLINHAYENPQLYIKRPVFGGYSVYCITKN